MKLRRGLGVSGAEVVRSMGRKIRKKNGILGGAQLKKRGATK